MNEEYPPSNDVDEPKLGQAEADAGEHEQASQEEEVGGRAGPEPTRYGDWEKNGRCIDF